MKYALWLLVGVSVLTHLLFLAQPREVVFDEVHFGKFITAYCCTGEHFFDIHPPHAKLAIAAFGYLGGYRGGFSFEHIGQSYENVPVFALRLFPALTGIVLPLVIYLLLQQLGASEHLGLLGGAAVLLDTALTLQTRVIALDGLLLVATFASLWLYLKSEKTTGATLWSYLVLAGALAGLALGTKFTGLAALGLLGVIMLVRVVQSLWQSRPVTPAWQWVVRGFVVLGSAAVVYLLGWYLHFALLPNPGSGDAFYTPTGQFWVDTAALHKVMFDANFNLTASHPDQSPWWSWPLMTTSVFYWQGGGEGWPQFMYFLGSPVVWWGASLLFVAAVGASVVSVGHKKMRAASLLWIPLMGYIIAMVPLVRVPRALFLYHYITPLIFSLIFGFLWVDSMLSAEHKQRFLKLGALALVVGFIWFSPLVYGIPIPVSLQGLIFWLPEWR